MKTKIAIFDLTGCEGCEFHLFSLNEQLLDIFQDFEIVNWRLLSAEQKKDFDIAFIEGAATTQKQIKLLKEIRKTSQVVVAMGACAISGNIFAELKPEQRKKLAAKIYNQNYQLKAKFLDPIEKYIKIDYQIPGCPPDFNKFKDLLSQFKSQIISSQIKDITPPEYTAKIEGHGRLNINFQQKQVKFQVEESERLVEGLLLKKNFINAPFITSRICGICPVAHNLCSWKAIEKALNIQISQETIILREIMLASQIIKSHLLHLFFLVLPDYAGLKSSLELSVKYPAEFHLMLNIKRVSEMALNFIAGSSSFPLNTALGGFVKPPTINDLLKINTEIYQVLDEALDLINLFSDLKTIPLNTNIKLLASNPDRQKYPFYQVNYTSLLKEAVLTYSTAKKAVLNDNTIVKVGAQSRLKLYSKYLNSRAKNSFEKTKPDLSNPFSNNLSQAIEILHFLEEIIILIDTLKNLNLENAKAMEKPVIAQAQVRGEAIIEAPRGILIHQVNLNNQGIILNYNIIPPTQINLASLEKEAQELVNQYSDYQNKALTLETEKLIRAFDPCITCAVH